MKSTIIIGREKFSQNEIFNNLNFYLTLHSTKKNESKLENVGGSSYFYLQSGTACIKTNSLNAQISEGMYFSINGPGVITLNEKSKAIQIFVKNFSSLNTLGGPVEEIGRLSYIDGCSDSLLLSPSRLGEPCLNLLHFPVHTKQTSHHHPSFRFGIVLSGSGNCVSDAKTEKLNTGDVFYIPPFVKHKFDTEEECMNIIAFHPDSDWGPTDEIHPMINRTII